MIQLCLANSQRHCWINMPPVAVIPQPVRYAEKRRTSTCQFADRIAQFCVDHYRCHVPSRFRESQKQTCLAAIVALIDRPSNGDNGCCIQNYESSTGCDSSSSSSSLFMLGMGVGTKFLTHQVLQDELRRDASYGTRVRDCHAEVLARRAFRRQISLFILMDLQQNTSARTILERLTTNDHNIKYKLKPGVSLHMYTSSAPCGNATIKKFATMKQETFREGLGYDEWPPEPHEPMIGHSIHLGQFALLVKKDPGCNRDVNTDTSPPPQQPELKSKKYIPALQTTDWCPPGTSTVWSQQGSIHTCSDKLLRWNCLGLQGSFLASLLQEPLYISSLTVGRKLTECICRRAVCCRAASNKKQRSPKKRSRDDDDDDDEATRQDCAITTTSCTLDSSRGGGFKLHHPAIMGTQVYMDERGVIDMSSHEHQQSNSGGRKVEGQDVRFHNSLSWVWWPSMQKEREDDGSQSSAAECIDGSTGLSVIDGDTATGTKVSKVSTASLLDLSRRIHPFLHTVDEASSDCEQESPYKLPDVNSLTDLRVFKKITSPEYEAHKEQLLTKHPLLRQWKRRKEACINYS